MNVTKIAYEFEYIWRRVGTDRWRFRSGEAHGKCVPYIEMPEWAEVSAGELVYSGAVEKCDKIKVSRPWAGHRCRLVRTYRLKDSAVEDALRATEGMIVPCGHRGIRNIDSGYECKHPGCDAVFSREAVNTM